MGAEDIEEKQRLAEHLEARATENVKPASTTGSESPDHRRPSISNILIAVELEIGLARKATLTVAPWQSRDDFNDVVQAFLKQQGVKLVFKNALVEYLVEV